MFTQLSMILTIRKPKYSTKDCVFIILLLTIFCGCIFFQSHAVYVKLYGIWRVKLLGEISKKERQNDTCQMISLIYDIQRSQRYGQYKLVINNGSCFINQRIPDCRLRKIMRQTGNNTSALMQSSGHIYVDKGSNTIHQNTDCQSTWMEKKMEPEEK